jgi:hypothetical protein
MWLRVPIGKTSPVGSWKQARDPRAAGQGSMCPEISGRSEIGSKFKSTNAARLAPAIRQTLYTLRQQDGRFYGAGLLDAYEACGSIGRPSSLPTRRACVSRRPRKAPQRLLDRLASTLSAQRGIQGFGLPPALSFGHRNSSASFSDGFIHSSGSLRVFDSKASPSHRDCSASVFSAFAWEPSFHLGLCRPSLLLELLRGIAYS